MVLSPTSMQLRFFSGNGVLRMKLEKKKSRAWTGFEPVASRYRCDALTMQLSYEATDAEKPLMLRRREYKKERKKSKTRGRKLGRGKAAEPVIFANFSHALHFRVSFPPLSLSLEQAT